jgi:hypothetical protein
MTLGVLRRYDYNPILSGGKRHQPLAWTGKITMHRVIAIMVGGLALAACSSNSDWLNLDALKPAPVMETVQFESAPPGAEVKVANGQTCRTPCALALPHPESGGYAATFTLNGYLPDTEQMQLISMGDNSSQLRPNPVVVKLTPAPPPPKPKKIVRRKPAAKHAAKPTTKPATKPAAKKPKAKPAAKPKGKPAAGQKPTAAAPPPPAAQQQPASSPWPPVQPQR